MSTPQKGSQTLRPAIGPTSSAGHPTITIFPEDGETELCQPGSPSPTPLALSKATPRDMFFHSADVPQTLGSTERVKQI